MKKVVVVLLISVLFISCSKLDGVRMKYINNTGYDLEKLEIDGQYIGTLGKGSKSNSVSFENVTFLNQNPYQYIDAKIKGEAITDNNRHNWCLTGMDIEVKENGSFEVELIIPESSVSYIDAKIKD